MIENRKLIIGLIKMIHQKSKLRAKIKPKNYIETVVNCNSCFYKDQSKVRCEKCRSEKTKDKPFPFWRKK